MKQFKHIIIISLVTLLLVSCFFTQEKPEIKDGNLNIELVLTIEDDSDSITTVIPVPGVEVKLTTSNYNLPAYYDTTDSNGIARFEGLPFAYYKAEAYSIIKPTPFTEVEVVGAKVLQLTADSLRGELSYCDSLIMQQSQRGLCINEIYSCGPKNNLFYFYDQFFELYNAMSETAYLDGMLFLRLRSTELFADTLSVIYIYQFPGIPLTGREYPIEPGEFVVLTAKAMDHNLIGPIKGKTVDLSNADWEFVNEIEPGAYDNPNVPNITTNNGKVFQESKVSFLVGVTGDGLALCDGSDYDQSDGIDIKTVIDCVEYASSETHIKKVPYSLDKSWGGIGLGKYSGQSLERIRPGFDTNNSRVDFTIISKPTPGYHHE